MAIDTVLFDLDDTLHDRNKSINVFIELLKEKYSHLISSENKACIKDVFFELDRRGYAPRDELFRELMIRTCWKARPEIPELIDFWNEEYPKCAEPMPKLYEVLDYILGLDMKIGIITNGDTRMQNTKLDKLGLRKYMKTIIISEEAGISKPDPGIFHLALSDIGSKAATVLFVGDYPSTDIKGALNTGLASAWISFGKKWDVESYRPDFIIDNLCGIMKIL